MNISRQVVEFALRLLTLKIELTCMHFEISSTAFELGKYSIPQKDSTGKFAQESHAKFLGFLITNLKPPSPTEMFVLPFKKSLKCLLLLLIQNVLTASVFKANGKHTIGKFSNESLKSPS